MLLLSDELMRYCVASISGCLDLRRRAFALDGRVSAECGRCPGSTARRARDSVDPLRKFSRLDACEDWKAVRWCRVQASYHNSQGAAVGRVDEAGVSTAAADRGAVLCGWVHHGQGGNSQSYYPSTPDEVSKTPQEREARCQLLAKWLKVSAIRERPVQRYLGIWARSRRVGFCCCIWL